MIGDRIVVDFCDRAFLGPDAGGEIAEMVDGKRHVGCGRLADRLAVVPGLRQGQRVEIGLHAVGDLVEDACPFGGRRLAPGILGRMGRIQRLFDVVLVGAGDLADRLSGNRRRVLEIAAVDRLHPLPADEVAIALFERHVRECQEFWLVHVVSSRDEQALLSKCRAKPSYREAAFILRRGNLLGTKGVFSDLMGRPYADFFLPQLRLS
jgi:hypothetical protein